MLILYIWGHGTNSSGKPMSTRLLIIRCVITAVVTVLDYLVPSYLTKKSGGSVYASRGAFAGFLCGTGLKLIASGMMMYYIFVYIR